MSVKKICMCLVFQVVVPEICIHYQCEYETRKKERAIYLIVLWKEMCSYEKNGEFAMFFFVDLKIQSVYENGRERWWFCTMERICSNSKKIRESSWKKNKCDKDTQYLWKWERVVVVLYHGKSVFQNKKNAEKAAENKSDKVIMVCPRNEVVGKKCWKIQRLLHDCGCVSALNATSIGWKRFCAEDRK